jgi:hypothetical protein
VTGPPPSPSHNDAPLSPNGASLFGVKTLPTMNLAIWVGAEMNEFMTKIGRMLPQYQNNDSWMLPTPRHLSLARTA